MARQWLHYPFPTPRASCVSVHWPHLQILQAGKLSPLSTAPLPRPIPPDLQLSWAVPWPGEDPTDKPGKVTPRFTPASMLSAQLSPSPASKAEVGAGPREGVGRGLGFQPPRVVFTLLPSSGHQGEMGEVSSSGQRVGRESKEARGRWDRAGGLWAGPSHLVAGIKCSVTEARDHVLHQGGAPEEERTQHLARLLTRSSSLMPGSSGPLYAGDCPIHSWEARGGSATAC